MIMSPRSKWMLGLSLLAMLALSLAAATRIPADAMIPIHWNIEGEPNGFAGKWEALLLAPAMTVVVSAIVYMLARAEPRATHLRHSAPALSALWVGLSLLMLAIHAMTIAGALGYRPAVNRLAPLGIGGFLVLLGNVLGKTRSNFFIGIRTPWTLSSERSWAVTHRWGGRGFVALGLAVVVAGLAAPGFAIWLILAGAVGLSIGLAVLSWSIWRHDPARIGY